jgi:hypothetical protein
MHFADPNLTTSSTVLVTEQGRTDPGPYPSRDFSEADKVTTRHFMERTVVRWSTIADVRSVFKGMVAACFPEARRRKYVTSFL